MIDWSDAPNFGRTGTLKETLEMLHSSRGEDIIIVETGTTRGTLGGGVIGDGWATLAFGWYCKKYGGEVYTVDILKEAIDECKEITKPYQDVIHYVVDDSVDFLSKFDKEIALLYLDSSDDSELIYNELRSIYDKLTDTSLVLIDDTHEALSRGKGTVAGRFLLENGWSLVLDYEGQVLFTRGEITRAENSRFYTLYEYEQLLAEGNSIELSLDDYDDRAKVWHNLFFDKLPKKEELPQVEGKVKVLDIGCHSGYNTRMLEDLYGYAEGIDISDILITASILNHDKCRQMPCDSLQYKDESFSLVVAKDVYEHCPSPAQAINEAYRVLADDGYILVMVPLDGEVVGMDDITLHPASYFGNKSHTWKATFKSVLRRIFEAGFTEVEPYVYNHSALFGEVRQLGDRVVVVKAQKRKGIQRAPKGWLSTDSYWCAFLSLSCTGDCSYCIQSLSPDEFVSARAEYNKNKLKPEEWVKFYNNLQKYKHARLGITGGEPTVYKGFYEVVNGIKGYYKTITTNLTFPPAFGDIHSFINNIKDKVNLRINTSFHPKITSVDEFCAKVHTLRNAGFLVDQVAMVDHPTSNFKYYYNEFIKRGLVLNPQTFLGKIDNVLLPNPESDLIRDHKEHGITNYPLYNEGFSCEKKQEVLCMTSRFLVAPDGGIYRCHYHLYSRRGAQGNILDEELLERRDYTTCDDFGYCNPCDFPHVKFKPTSINIPDILLQQLENEDLVKSVVEYFTNNEKVLSELVTLISTELYLSDDTALELYNNTNISQAINTFIEEGGEVNNYNAVVLAELSTIFNINVYRLLKTDALLKYLDALGYVVYLRNLDGGIAVIEEKLRDPKLMKCLDVHTATIFATFGIIPIYPNKFVILRNQ